jgi:hypothetical protein
VEDGQGAVLIEVAEVTVVLGFKTGEATTLRESATNKMQGV